MNVSDSEIVASVLRSHDYVMTDAPEDADAILVNTCAIRDGAEAKVWHRLRQLRAIKTAKARANRRAAKRAALDVSGVFADESDATKTSSTTNVPVVGVLGCMGERLKEKILERDGLADLVAGPDAYRDLPRLIDAARGAVDGDAFGGALETPSAGDEGETGVFFATGAKKPTGESAADPDALASGLALASAFLSDDRAREALAAHAERHAGALVSALCRVSVSVSRDGGLAMAAREDALDALAAAAERGSLPFAAVYPRRREATEAATRALDDPKRRVRRMAARCKEAWRELGEAQ